MGRTKATKRTNKIYKNEDFETSRRQIARKNEIVTNRLLILFGIAVVLIACFVYFMNMPVSDGVKLRKISFVCLCVLGAMLLFSAVFLIQRYRTGIDESDKTVTSKNIFATILLLFLADLLIFFTYYKWIPFLTVAAISLTVIVYIYCLYQREFFVFSVFAAIGSFLVYFGKNLSLSSVYITASKIMLIVLAVLIFAFALTVGKNRGFLFDPDAFQKNFKRFPFYILAAVFAVSAVIEIQTFVGINFLYILIANLAYFIFAGIYYTVKMIQK